MGVVAWICDEAPEVFVDVVEDDFQAALYHHRNDGHAMPSSRRPTRRSAWQSSSSSSACSGEMRLAFNASPTASMSCCHSRARTAAHPSSARRYSILVL